MLETPVTIRLPRMEEMPERQDLEQLLIKRKTAKITEGFRITENTTLQLPFRFLAEININNSGLWDLFLALSSAFPTEISLQYGLYEEELVVSPYFTKAKIITELLPLKQELVMDGSLIFGLLSHTKKELLELLVTESKYIKFWGNDSALFLDIMRSFNLKEMPDLEFIDEYPKIVEPLKKFIPASRPPVDVIWKLNRLFGRE